MDTVQFWATRLKHWNKLRERKNELDTLKKGLQKGVIEAFFKKLKSVWREKSRSVLCPPRV